MYQTSPTDEDEDEDEESSANRKSQFGQFEMGGKAGQGA